MAQGIWRSRRKNLKGLSIHANIYILKELTKSSTIFKRAMVFCPIATTHTLRIWSLFCKCMVVSALWRKMCQVIHSRPEERQRGSIFSLKAEPGRLWGWVSSSGWWMEGALLVPWGALSDPVSSLEGRQGPIAPLSDSAGPPWEPPILLHP